MTAFRAGVAVRETLEAGMSRPDLSLCAIALWHNLATRVDRRGSTFVGVERLAESLGVRPATIRRARAELVAAGMIRVTLTRGGRGHTNTYWLPLQTVAVRPADYPQPARQRAGSQSPTRAPARAAPRNPRVRRTETRAVAREEVVQEVAGNKRSEPVVVQRRRRSPNHPTYGRAAS